MKIATLVTAILMLLAPINSVGAAELLLRDSLLQQQKDRVTATITATVEEIGDHAHPLTEDCDLHVPLRSRDIWVPLLGEVKNACSMPPSDPAQTWPERIAEEVFGREVLVTGVFRIWLEHPPSGDVVQIEGAPIRSYENSNPDHQVELHPLVQIGSIDLRDHIKQIEKGSDEFEGFGPDRLPTVLNKTLTLQRIEQNGETYIRIRGTKTGFNHWNLRARVVQAAEALPDGLRFFVDILDGNVVVPDALSVPVTAIAGTAAATAAESLQTGNIIRFQALIRLYIPTIMDNVGAAPVTVPLPIEFVVLDLALSS